MDLSVEIKDLTSRRSLEQLRLMAAKLQLDQSGTKLDLAARVAECNAKNESRLWDVVSGKA